MWQQQIYQPAAVGGFVEGSRVHTDVIGQAGSGREGLRWQAELAARDEPHKLSKSDKRRALVDAKSVAKRESQVGVRGELHEMVTD